MVVDNFDARVAAIRHLIELGHTRIAHIAAPLPPDAADRRTATWPPSPKPGSPSTPAYSSKATSCGGAAS
jgi:hypothetical protein